jgi:hypothetical protein
MVTHDDKFFFGKWNIVLEHKDLVYRWEFETAEVDDDRRVVHDRLVLLEDDNEVVIIDRTPEAFRLQDQTLPKLSPRQPSIRILREEDIVSPLYQAFSSIIRRRFSKSALEDARRIQPLSPDVLEQLRKDRDLDQLFGLDRALSCRLYLLSEVFPKVYEAIIREFKATFPFVSEVQFGMGERADTFSPSIIPIFALTEEGIEQPVPLPEFSSGMAKVLLILTDIFTLPSTGAVYMIDEYENSLGIGAISFFPSVLLETDTPSQFIITSHHPYIIGNVPVKDWHVLHRKGRQILVKSGKELEDRFGRSKQRAFIQLINDPFYVEGVE